MSEQPQTQTSLSTPRIAVNSWVILIVMAMGFFMILLDTTIVNVAIPSIIDGLHASLDQILWVLNAYLLVYAVLLITAGRLGDMVGPKRLFLSGLVIFVLGSAACGLAQNPDQLIFFRVVQGVGGAILTPQTLSVITSIFRPEQRGAAFGIWAAVAGVAASTGPTLGGFLTTAFSWRAIFYVNVPIGIVTILAAILVMPELTVHRKHHLDVRGITLASVGLFAGVFGLIEGQRYNWGPITNFLAFSIGSVRASLFSIPSLLLVAVVLVAIFAFQEVGEQEPLLPLTLFKDRNFSIANSVSFIMAFGMMGLFLTMTIFLQAVLGLKAVNAGVVFLPMTLTSMVVAPFAGRLVDRVNGKWVLGTGLVLFALGNGLVISMASLTSTGLSFTPPLLIAGIGMGATFAPMVTLAMRRIQPAQAGAASGFINTVRQMGSVTGTAVLGAVLQNRLAVELKSEAVKYALSLPASVRAPFVKGFSHAGSSGLAVGRGQTGASYSLPHSIPPSVAHHIHALGLQVFQHAFLNAMKPTLAIAIGAVVLAALLTPFMYGSGPKRQEQRATQRITEPLPAE